MTLQALRLFTKRKMIITFSFVFLTLFFVPFGISRVKPYYSGEIVSYNDNIFIGTTNTGSFELFSLENGKIYKKTSIMSQETFRTDFSDMLFRQEGSRLFVYLVNGDLYKYDISDPYYPILVAKIRDNSRDFFDGVILAGDKIATMGTKGVKVWNNNLQVINFQT